MQCSHSLEPTRLNSQICENYSLLAKCRLPSSDQSLASQMFLLHKNRGRCCTVDRQCLAAKLVPKLVTDRPTEERPATQHDDSSASVSDVLSNMTN
ncbi:hypothetical protein NQ318_013139 [Aromia moschata]|uniref:Uncharacterized protein n=1 Tax=Aromia moschata TaxID=1265417 RepID=A0AAV8Y076_9CUCU|nr:hypothetical protein NQ318_013139 [Aromia moschata]